jgi:hypothetical protein
MNCELGVEVILVEDYGKAVCLTDKIEENCFFAFAF